MPRRTLYLRAGVASLLAGIAIWGAFTIDQHSHGKEAAAQLLAKFSNQDDLTEQQATAEAQAQLQLMQTDRYTRRVFLQTALQDGADARRLRGREQAFEVSLSRVNSRDARELFDDAILPAIRSSTDPDILHEGIELMDRWGIAATLGSAQVEKLAAALVEAMIRTKMMRTKDTDQIGGLGSGVETLAPFLRAAAVDELVSKVVAATLEEANASVNDARLPALMALERKVSEKRAEALAEQIADRMGQERDAKTLRTLAAASRDLESKLSDAAAGHIAATIVPRIAMEARASALGSLSSGLEALSEKISPATAAELAPQIAQRMILEEGADLNALLPAWRALAPRVSSDRAEGLAGLLTQRMSMRASAHALTKFAAALADLQATPAAFERAGAILIARMRVEVDADALAELAAGVGTLRKKLSSGTAEEAAEILVRRITAEPDAGALGAMAASLDALDEGLSKSKAGELASVLVKRMRSESNSAALLSLASGFLAVAEQADGTQAGDQAAALLERVQTERKPEVLRTLAFCIAAVAESANAGELRKAAAKLATQMSIETDPEALKSLTAGLLALKDKAGEENFEKAGAVLAARINLESDFAGLHDLAASLHALAHMLTDGRASPASTYSAAAGIVKRMIDTRDAVAVDALGRSLNLIAKDLDEHGAAEIASTLVNRASVEPQANLLRAYGEVLGSLPVGSLTASQIAKLDRMFAIPNAPCQIVTRVKSEELAPLVRQILNPSCFEDGWMATVAALGVAAKQELVKPTADRDEIADEFVHLIAKDDDDESSADSAAAAEADSHVDFNKLSQVLDGLRPGDGIPVVPALAALLAVIGVVLLISGRAYRLRDAAP